MIIVHFTSPSPLLLHFHENRREGASDEMAVKPLTQFPVHLLEEVLEEKYSRFRGVRTVTVRKVRRVKQIFYFSFRLSHH